MINRGTDDRQKRTEVPVYLSEIVKIVVIQAVVASVPAALEVQRRQ